jgi:hypothetical protein
MLLLIAYLEILNDKESRAVPGKFFLAVVVFLFLQEHLTHMLHLVGDHFVDSREADDSVLYH